MPRKPKSSSQYKIRRKIPDPKYSLDEIVRPHVRKSPRNPQTKEQLAIAPIESVSPAEAQPFLKWVGGKSQLLAQFDEFFPAKIDRYVEPFIGGGAVFFHLKHRFPKMKAFLRDNNDELINTYVAVRDYPRELMHRLDRHLKAFQANRENYYYETRSKHHLPKSETVERAARMIFLNKTCYNGLWRVNSRGEFNVPIGSHKNPSLYDEENILAASYALRGVHLDTKDFRDALDETRRGEFVYIDPPYFPVSPTASFTSYTKDDFGAEEQRELAALFVAAANRGVHLMLSNSDTDFIRKLYRRFATHIVRARRMVNCDGTKRGEINEVVICTEG
ncbi:MAG TPA: DNA adenine methylase [Verrucomicrobiae bacterium]|nr:DNA adenine methylase [Verrucomicrobiae bacterium]